MTALLPLIRTMIEGLDGDGLLQQQMGGTLYTFAYEAPDDQAFPFITVEPISMLDWSAGNFDGDDIQMRVHATFKRGGPADNTGYTDVAKACERIRSVLAGRDGFNLAESPMEGASLTLDFTTGPIRVEPSTDRRLVMFRYQGTEIIPGLLDAAEGGGGASSNSITGVVTFRALIGPAN